MPTDLIKLAIAPYLAALIGPSYLYFTVSPYVVNGTLYNTIFPLTFFLFLSRSSKLSTTTTSPLTPALLVDTLPPIPSTLKSRSKGTRIFNDSSPLIHVGTFTLSPLTFVKPSFFISLIAQSIARSRFLEPLNLGPNISHKYPNLL